MFCVLLPMLINGSMQSTAILGGRLDFFLDFDNAVGPMPLGPFAHLMLN